MAVVRLSSVHCDRQIALCVESCAWSRYVMAVTEGVSLFVRVC